MAKKSKTLETRVREYLEKRKVLLESLEISEETIIAVPGKTHPGLIMRLALLLMRVVGARMQFNFQDLSKK